MKKDLLGGFARWLLTCRTALTPPISHYRVTTWSVRVTTSTTGHYGSLRGHHRISTGSLQGQYRVTTVVTTGSPQGHYNNLNHNCKQHTQYLASQHSLATVSAADQKTSQQFLRPANKTAATGSIVLHCKRATSAGSSCNLAESFFPTKELQSNLSPAAMLTGVATCAVVTETVSRLQYWSSVLLQVPIGMQLQLRKFSWFQHSSISVTRLF